MRKSPFLNWRRRCDCAAALLRLPVIVAAAMPLADCSSSSDFAAGTKASPRVVALGQPVPKGGGVHKLGKPYKVAGNWYIPREEPGYRKQGTASWYGEDFHGRYTANGEIYDMETLSAAHPTMPLPSYAEVTNLDNGRKVVVRVNDRGPYAYDRVMDVSKKAAELLGFKRKGTTRVEVAYIGPAPLDGADGWAVNIPHGAPATSFAAAAEPAPLPQVMPIVTAQANNEPVQRGFEQPQILPASFTPPVAAAPAAVLAPGSYVLAGTFRDPGNARRLGETIAMQGFPVDIAPLVANGAQMYKVRVGPLSPQGASRAFSLAVSAGAAGARIVEIR